MPKTLVLKTKHDWEAAWLVYLGDATLEEISEMFDIKYGTVVEYSRSHYWAARRKSAKERGLSVTAQQLKSRIERGRNKHLNHMLDQIDETQEHIAELQVSKPGEEDKTKVSVGHKLSLIEQHDRIARKTLGLDEEKTGDPTRDGFNFLIGMAKASKALESGDASRNEESFEAAKHLEDDSSQKQLEGENPNVLVNENKGNTESEESLNIIDVDSETTQSEGESEAANTSSAVSPLPVDSEAFAGILSPFKGHTNGHTNMQNEPILEESGETGDSKASKEVKKLPVKFILTSR